MNAELVTRTPSQSLRLWYFDTTTGQSTPFYHNFTATTQNTSHVTYHNELYCGMDWIFSFLEKTPLADIEFWYFWFTFTAESFYELTLSNILLFFLCKSSSFILYWSILLDNMIFVKLMELNVCTTWFLLSTWMIAQLQLQLPMLWYSHEFSKKSYADLINAEYFLRIKNKQTIELANDVFLLFLDFLALNTIIIFGLMLYFSYFSNSVKEEGTLDNDFMLSSITIEAEEEIASIDDMLFAIFIVMYVFGWFFYIHCWVIITTIPELTLTIYLFPVMYYVILSIPTFLVYDFGIFFLAYLKGSSQSSLLLLELVYDYIALAAFYIRILVQGVRLILMTFTYYNLQEFILSYNVDQKWFLGSEDFLENFYNLSTSTQTFNYFMIFHFFAKIMNWLYELIHTFFVLTAQFIAFFAMIFWLFFFLYTFFITEKHEAYFEVKRKQRKDFFNKLLKLRN